MNPAPARPAKPVKTIVTVALTALVAATLVGYYFWRDSVRQQIAVSAAELAPDLRGANPELVERILAARTQIQLNRQPAAALATLMRLYYANGWLEPAARACTGLVELEPRNPQWTYVLALLRANAGQLEEALPLLQQTVARAPDYLPARLKAASVMEKLNQTEAAIAMNRKVLEKDPGNIYAWVGLGNIYLSQRKWEAARDSFQKAISFANEFRPAWLGLVSVYDSTANSAAAAEARTHVDEVSRSPDSPDPWIDAMQDECYNVYYLRVAAFSNPDINAARHLLERAVQLQPKDAAVRRDFGLLLFRAKAFGEAQQHLNLATTLAPDDSENWLSLITFLRAIRDEAGTARAVQNGLAHCPASPGLWLERGRMLQRAHAFEQAAAAFARSAELGPKDAAPHVESAVGYFQLNQPEKALAELKTALTLQPNHPFALVVMARYAIVVGDKATALAYLEKARRNPAVLPEDLTQLVAAFEAGFGAPPR